MLCISQRICFSLSVNLEWKSAESSAFSHGASVASVTTQAYWQPPRYYPPSVVTSIPESGFPLYMHPINVCVVPPVVPAAPIFRWYCSWYLPSPHLVSTFLHLSLPLSHPFSSSFLYFPFHLCCPLSFHFFHMFIIIP